MPLMKKGHGARWNLPLPALPLEALEPTLLESPRGVPVCTDFVVHWPNWTLQPQDRAEVGSNGAAK